MVDETYKWYIEAIKHEINYEIKKNAKFSGNIVFQINMSNGNIANMNVGNNKSLKRIERD